ncbi:SWIM zinc finger family protein [bacterium D16-54]|nr:SWIM zinc finger family protein [bacterium D16-54]RKJ16111.1 SWIM zinc finger family protein [bacterium D16-56]
MRKFSEQQIGALAPNANALSNGRKISSGGGFVSRMRSEDDTFYMGECKGSGKSNYVVSADFVEDDKPVFRCSCPSRQFPCKHSLALMFEMAAQKDFPVGDIPKDILEKREKKQAREAKKTDPSEAKKPVSEKSSRAGKAARTKKIKKQLEGLGLMKQMTDQLMNTGLSSMGSVSLKNYRDLAKQLGDYYLPGPQNYFNRLVLEMEVYQKDQDKSHYHQAVEVLKRLRALEKKAAVYLNGKLDTDSPEADDDILYEKLGGIWKLDQLEGLGLKKEHARLVQLSFQVIYDEARKEYIDIGYWADVDTGEISSTYNYRPVKALKYVKQEDSCFDVVNTPMLCYYPGGMNKRIRWENADFEPMDGRVLADVTAHAHREIQTAVKLAKNEMKNLLSEDYCGMLLRYERIGTIRTKQGDLWVLEDETGGRMELAGREGWEDTMTALSLISDPEVYRGQALFGLLYYDSKERRIRMYPCSIVTEKGIVRLLY